MNGRVITTRGAVGGALTGWICATAGVVGAVALGALFDWSSGARTAFVSVLGVTGCLLGGFRAGLLERDAPLSNGAAAGALTALALALIGLVQDPARIGALLFAVFLGASFGTFGGMVSNVSARR